MGSSGLDHVPQPVHDALSSIVHVHCLLTCSWVTYTVVMAQVRQANCLIFGGALVGPHLGHRDWTGFILRKTCSGYGTSARARETRWRWPATGLSVLEAGGEELAYGQGDARRYLEALPTISRR